MQEASNGVGSSPTARTDAQFRQAEAGKMRGSSPPIAGRIADENAAYRPNGRYMAGGRCKSRAGVKASISRQLELND